MNYKLFLGVLLASAGPAAEANPITKAQARLVAQELVGIDDATSDDVPLSPYYIFSRGAGRGFVIASGDDTTAPILGYTEQGDFERDQLPPQLQLMLDQWDERLGQVQAGSRRAAAAARAPRARAIAAYKQGWTDVPALVKTHWHQSDPYNMLAPVKAGMGRCMAGCVATAGSQVTYYFHKDNPSELAYDTPTYGYGTPVTVSLPKGTPIEWNQMKLSGKGTARQDSAVARLMYALGTSAWLTYGDGEGTATSGHNYKLADAMNGQFQLTSAHWEKSGSSQQKWETKIYDNLKTRRPLLYSGVHPDQGGHSVVLDGYQASTGLYHFNFGWGGQGDGWYTVDDETGMNGFNSYQDIICDITPKVQNLKGGIEAGLVYHKAPSTVRVSVTNNGTLDYQGVSLYLNAQSKLSSTPSASDLTTELPAGKTVEMEFTVTHNAAKAGTVYLFLCDKNKNIIDSCHLEATPTVADLQLDNLRVDASDEVDHIGQQDYLVVNNTTANVTATLTNGQQGTYCMPSMQCYLDSLDRSAGEWKRVTSRIANKTVFEQGQTQQADFSFASLKEGALYKVYMNKSIQASEKSEISIGTPDSVVYFIVRKSDLVVSVSGTTATVTGRWNDALFRQKANDASVCSYDITGLTQLNTQPEAANPNALFYAGESQSEWADFNNVVVGDVCRNLIVRSDADFKSEKSFTAAKVSFVLADAETNKYHGVLVPFALKVPQGMQVRQMEGELESSAKIISHKAVSEVAPMSVVLYLTSHEGLKALTGEQVAVGTVNSLSLYDGLLVASTQSMAMPAGALVLSEYLMYNMCYQVPASDQTVLPAFQPALLNMKSSSVRTSSETSLDTYYRQLAVGIDNAYKAMEGKPDATEAQTAALKAVLAEAEEFFTSRSGDTTDSVGSMNKKVEAAVKDFLSGMSDGIVAVRSLPSAAPAAVYSVSGQRLSQRTRGLVIVQQDGKYRKVLQK